MNQKVVENMRRHNCGLSKYACKDDDAIRLKQITEDIRTPFFRDTDKVIYSLGYTRYLNKTQVFTKPTNDMISRRITHVQMVSKVARTIGRALGLNEDLIEAASLGHDLGHVPYGHEGETVLNKLSLKYGEGYFNHNVQSVRLLTEIENGGEGYNLTIQVLDAILCHNGEMLKNIYEPVKKTTEEFLKEYEMSYKDKCVLKKIRPMTLEGCVVRISDVIAYVGKDIEDGIRMGVVSKKDIPSNVAKVLGTTNSQIVNTLVLDIIENSLDRNYIKLSEDVFKALQELLTFNYKNVYYKSNTAEKLAEYETNITRLFELYYNQIENNLNDEEIFVNYLNYKNEEYNLNNSTARKVIDYIAGMTDNFIELQCKKYFD